MQIESVKLLRRPPGSCGNDPCFAVTVSVRNQAKSDVYVSSTVQRWNYNAGDKTLTIDFTSEPTSAPPHPDGGIGYAIPQRAFPFTIATERIAPHSGAQLHAQRSVITRQHRLNESNTFQTEETDISQVKHVVINLRAHSEPLTRGESEGANEAEARFRGWGKLIQSRFDATLEQGAE